MSIAAMVAAAAQKKGQKSENMAGTDATPHGGSMSIAAMAAAAAQKKAGETKTDNVPTAGGPMNIAAASAIERQTQPKVVDDSMPASDAELTIRNDPTYTKFFKMLQMGLPMEVVKHAMTRDGMDPSIMDHDHDKSLASQRPSKIEKGEDEPPLKEDEKYQKYFKMLKMVSLVCMHVFLLVLRMRRSHFLLRVVSRAFLWVLSRMP